MGREGREEEGREGRGGRERGKGKGRGIRTPLPSDRSGYGPD